MIPRPRQAATAPHMTCPSPCHKHKEHTPEHSVALGPSHAHGKLTHPRLAMYRHHCHHRRHRCRRHGRASRSRAGAARVPCLSHASSFRAHAPLRPRWPGLSPWLPLLLAPLASTEAPKPYLLPRLVVAARPRHALLSPRAVYTAQALDRWLPTAATGLPCLCQLLPAPVNVSVSPRTRVHPAIQHTHLQPPCNRFII